MELNKYRKSIFKTIVFASLISCSFVSCDFIIENKKKNALEYSDKQNRIAKNKSEAKLLVMASQSNIEVIELCQVIKNANVENDIKQFASNLKKTHQKILKDYKNLAEKKLITIPYYATVEIENTEEIVEKNEFIESNLKLITKKISTQIDLLKKLSKTTNKEFQEMSVKTSAILELELDETNIMLNAFKANIKS